MARSETILSIQTHPGDSTSESITGEKYKGDGYYGRSDGIHTVQYNLTGFLGNIVMQATLAVEPTDADWFTVTTTEHESVTPESEDSDGNFIKNFTGNFVWVRAVITNWTDGTINSILLNH